VAGKKKHAPGSPYSLGYDAGALIALMMLGRGDHSTSAVEWYRGFCAGSGQKTDPKIEVAVSRFLLDPAIAQFVPTENAEVKP
jgi:hypothetical protein